VTSVTRSASMGSSAGEVEKTGFLRRFRIRRLSSSASSSEETDSSAGGVHETLDSLLASISPAFEQRRASLLTKKLEDVATRDWVESTSASVPETRGPEGNDVAAV
jgi:hypothetical protein